MIKKLLNYKKYLYITGVFILLLLMNWYLYSKWQTEKTEAKRYKDNYEVVTSQLEYHKSKNDSLLYAYIGTIEQRTNELSDSLVKGLT